MRVSTTHRWPIAAPATLLSLLLAALLSQSAVAEEEAPDLPPDLIPVEGPEPYLDEVGELGEQPDLEPQVTIRRRGGNVIEEYRVGGRLYRVRITPQVGPAYYLVDSDGDGYMDVRQDDLKRPPAVPRWVLLEWDL